MRKILVLLIRGYQYLVSPLLGPHCRFYPSCSSYAQTAVERHGVIRGSWLALRRLSRCHPWHVGGEDPVPEIKTADDLSSDFGGDLCRSLGSNDLDRNKEKCRSCGE